MSRHPLVGTGASYNLIDRVMGALNMRLTMALGRTIRLPILVLPVKPPAPGEQGVTVHRIASVYTDM